LTNLFLIVDIMFRCNLQRYVRSQFKVGPKSVFAYSLWPVVRGDNALRSSDQIFQIAVIIDYVSKFG